MNQRDRTGYEARKGTRDKVRLQLGDIPVEHDALSDDTGLRLIRSPSLRMSYLLAALVGIALLSVLCVAVGAWSWAVAERGRMAVAGDAVSPWGAVLMVLALFIPLHEALHVLFHPQWGRSSRSVLAVWPAKLRFGVYFEGCMSRTRWLVMRLAPLLLLSFLPALLVGVLQTQAAAPPELEIGLQVMMVVNALGSGGDVVAALIVVAQVPAGAFMCFQSGRAYWRPA